MADISIGEPVLVFEDSGLLIPWEYNFYGRRKEILIDDLSQAQNLARDRTMNSYKKDLFELVSNRPSAHVSLVLDTGRVCRKLEAFMSGQKKVETIDDDDYISDLFMAAKSDAGGMRQLIFQTEEPTGMEIINGTWKHNEAQKRALTLYTPHLRESDGALLTKVYLLRSDIEKYPNNLPLPEVIPKKTYVISVSRTQQ
jgi:hypothetical protein